MNLHIRLFAPILAGLLVGAAAATALAQEPMFVTDVNGDEVAIEDTSRTATLGGVFTETAYALGAQDQLVAVDASSFYPPEALTDKPDFGYYRFLSAEPVLAEDPSLIIGNEETGPPEVVQQLRDAGVPILLLPDNNDVQAARDLIDTLGSIFDREAAGGGAHRAARRGCGRGRGAGRPGHQQPARALRAAAAGSPPAHQR